MRAFTLERKLVAAVLFLFLVPTVLAGAVLLYLYRRGALDDPSTLALTIAIGFVAMMAYLGVTAHAIGRTLVRTLQQIQRGTELMATVNPEYRHRIETGDELQALAEEINRMADRVRNARLGLEQEVTRATHALTVERTKLTAILAELDAAVIVATIDGRITLANRAAQQLFGGQPLLGRELGDVLDRDTITDVRARLGSDRTGAQRFTLSSAVSESPLEAGITYLYGRDGEASELILALRDVSRAGRQDAIGHVGLGSALYDASLFEAMERHVAVADRERRLDEVTFVVLDAETTGLRPETGDRIVSLAAVKVRRGAVRRGEAFDALVQPGRPVPPASSRLHGITDAMLAEAPPIDVVLPAFERFAAGSVLVGHEIWFDLRFLSLEATRLARPSPAAAHPILDARLLSQVVHGKATAHTLEAMAERMGVPLEGRHSALGDALITAEILVRLLPLLAKRGIVTLGQALDATRALGGSVRSRYR